MKNSIWKINYTYQTEEEKNKIRNCLCNKQLPYIKFTGLISEQTVAWHYGDVVFVYISNHIKVIAMVTRPGVKKKTTAFQPLFSREIPDLLLSQDFEVTANKVDILTSFTNDEINSLELDVLLPEFSISMEDFLNTWHKTYSEYRYCLYIKKGQKSSVYNFDAAEVQNLSKSRRDIKAQDALLPWHRMPGSGFSKA